MARDIHGEIKEKLGDPVLRQSLSVFGEQYPASRLKAYEGYEIEPLRDALRDMKQEAVAHLDEIADQFQKNVEAHGGIVYRAKDGDDVKQYLLKVCQENNVKRIVKSKSMASEEIQLNEAFEKNGIHIRETDLGEWMLAVAGQHPSHMVMPAIHLNKEQCAKFFEKELKHEVPPEIPYMIQTARRILREEFLSADLGFTGANFGIAENGAIGLVTNEGNARLVTTVPRIHVVLIGYEKLIPKIEDASKILRLLVRNGTCQRLTSYMTMVNGTNPTMIKKDGKWVEEERKQYVILLDNGRLAAAKDPVLKQAFQCVRCCSCLNVCPIWTLVGGNVYGHIYSGGIGAILTGILGKNAIENFSEFSDLCIGCRKCTTVCPGKIPIPDLIDELRHRNVQKHGMPAMQKMVFQNIMANRGTFHSLIRMASKAQVLLPFKSGRYIRNLPLFFADMTKDRSLPAIADTPFRDKVKSLESKNPKSPRKKVAFFAGCSIDFVFPETGESVVKVLQDLNCAVTFPQGQTCCGKPIVGMGDRETTKKLAMQNLEAFEKEAANCDVILCACPTCTETLEATYKTVFRDDPAMVQRLDRTFSKVREFSEFVAELYKEDGRLNPVSSGGERVTYHGSCHMERGLKVHDQPRDLLNATKGVEFVEMNNSDKCCGMSGAFGVRYAELSRPLLEEKIKNIRNTGAQTVAVACSACRMQIGGGLDQQMPNVKVKHIADILAEHLGK